MNHRQRYGLGARFFEKLDQGLNVQAVEARSIDFHNLVPRTQPRAGGRRVLSSLEDGDFSGLHVQDGAEAQRLPLFLLLEQLELVGVEEGRKRVERREHPANPAL